MPACSAVFAGPFSIEMGWTYDQLVASGVQILDTPYINNNVVSFLVAPEKTHPSFDCYIVRIDEKEGVYDIEAHGTVSTNEYGTQVKESYESIKQQLVGNYDEPIVVEYLHSGSIWDEPRDWMMSLVKQERTCLSFWTFEGRADCLECVTLELTAEYSNTGNLGLIYQSDKTHEILERLKFSQASVL